MKTSPKGMELIKKHEGLRLRAYLCPAMVWTIGYGHTGTAREGLTITQAQADELLRADVEWAEREVLLMNVRLSQNQFDALVSLVFNIGIGAFRRSTARRLIVANANDPAIGAAIRKWNRAKGRVLPGLVTRRNDESQMYFT